ncbi:MAG TPA: hypothetical protein PLE33_08920 [Candidatus Cloacimonas sp.]|nr:hypothetical protein [Candidatus Cloacimonas sp.]
MTLEEYAKQHSKEIEQFNQGGELNTEAPPEEAGAINLYKVKQQLNKIRATNQKEKELINGIENHSPEMYLLIQALDIIADLTGNSYYNTTARQRLYETSQSRGN